MAQKRLITTPTTAAGRNGVQPQAPMPVDPNEQYRRLTTGAATSRANAGTDVGFYGDPLGKGLSTAASLYDNPVVSTIPWAAKRVGGVVDDQLGVNVSGYVQDPLGQGLSDVGAPDFVQAVANPTGYATRTAVKAGTGYGINVPQSVSDSIQGGTNIANDAKNVYGAVDDIAGDIAAGGLGGLGDVFGDPGGGLSQYAEHSAALGAGARAALDPVTAQRNTQAQDMFGQGAAAQGRAASQTGYVDYGGPQTLAQAQQAATGNFGAEQRVSAARVGAAQQAQAQQASATQAGNQAGFLSGTAQNARGIADLNFAQSDESRAAMGQNLNRISSYVDQGPGESMAQAQLRMAQEQNLGSALSLARSGRGNAAGNMKMAISENAATNAQTNQQAALLRATEADQWRGRQLQGLGLEQAGTSAMRTQDVTAAQAQGQHAISREQIASNVDVSRAGLEQGLAQFNAGAQNQASITNAQLGTNVSLGNAEQANMGTRLQAQLSNDASIQQAGLANARNVALGQSGTQASIANADNSAAAERTRAQLANELAVAQGNSSTNINQANLDAQVRQNQLNDAQQQSMYGYGLDSQQQGLDAQTSGLGFERDYSQQANQLAAEIAKARAIRQAALIGGGASLIENIIPG